MSKNKAETGYQGLANAIVLQAVKDYRNALKAKRRNPDSIAAEKTIKEVERFFRSQWCERLTDAEGEYLIRKLSEEVNGS